MASGQKTHFAKLSPKPEASNDPASTRNPRFALQPRVIRAGVRGVEVAGSREGDQGERKSMITAEDPREVMFDTFGPKWAMQYEEPPDMRRFPRGIFEL